MALYRDIQFNKGSATDLLGAVPTITGATFNKDKKGFALQTGISKYVQYDRQLLPNGACSIIIWCKLKSSHIVATDRGIIIDSGNGGVVPALILSQNANGGRPIFYLNTSNFKYFNYIPDKKWHCYIFTINGNAQTDILTSNLYVDTLIKAETSSASSNSQLSRSNITYIGKSAGSSSGLDISRLKVYDHVLTENERKEEQKQFELAQPLTLQQRNLSLQKPTEVKQSGLIAKYNMKPVGGILHDISGNGKHITVPVGGYISAIKGLRSINKDVSGTTNNLVASTVSATDFTYCVSHEGMTFPIGATIFKKVKYIGYGATNLQYYEGSVQNFTPAIPITVINKNGTIVFTYTNSTKLLSVYINGVLTGTTTFATAIGTTNFESIFNASDIGNKQINGTIKDISIYNIVKDTQFIKAYHNQFNEVILHEQWKDTPVGSSILPSGWIKNGGSFTVQESTTNDAVLPIRKGYRYVKCNTAGIIAIPSKQAYGTWEFDWYKGGEGNTISCGFINDNLKFFDGADYSHSIVSNESIILYKGAGTAIITTATGYISNNTNYRTRLTRTTSGIITIYIKGGAYINWTLVGTATDTTYNTSNYLVFDIDTNDRVGEVIQYSQIKQ